MVFPVNPIQRAVALYGRQHLYGERIRAFSKTQSIVQTQKDRTEISPSAKRLQQASRKNSEPLEPITYSHPGIDNPRLGSTYPLKSLKA